MQVFLDNLQEADNVEIYESRNKEKCYNVKATANNSSITETKGNIIDSTTEMPISLDINTPLKTLSKKTSLYQRSRKFHKQSS